MMASDVHDDPKADTAIPGGPPPSEQSAIRGAFLARQAKSTSASGGESEGEAGSASLRGAFLNRLTRETRAERQPRSRASAAGTEETGGAVLRGIYAARTMDMPAPGRTRRAAKKARPARVGAKKSARKPAPKAARKAAPKRKARAAAPARRTGKAPRKAARRR